MKLIRNPICRVRYKIQKKAKRVVLRGRENPFGKLRRIRQAVLVTAGVLSIFVLLRFMNSSGPILTIVLAASTFCTLTLLFFPFVK
ncbi:MAG: hypothetical protein ABIJ27_00535 [Candidatus Omnitrophota bacterium]